MIITFYFGLDSDKQGKTVVLLSAFLCTAVLTLTLANGGMNTTPWFKTPYIASQLTALVIKVHMSDISPLWMAFHAKLGRPFNRVHFSLL